MKYDSKSNSNLTEFLNFMLDKNLTQFNQFYTGISRNGFKVEAIASIIIIFIIFVRPMVNDLKLT